jgi:hypothetical protein
MSLGIGSENRTVRDVLQALGAPSRTKLGKWPPDVFALTSELLAGSGAYPVVVSPDLGKTWPPTDQPEISRIWSAQVELANRWAARTGRRQAPPAEIRGLLASIYSAMDLQLHTFRDEPQWPLICSLLMLHALADEACRDLALGRDGPYTLQAQNRLLELGTLSNLSPTKVRVVPKYRVPQTGITLRSLSAHVAAIGPEVNTVWRQANSRQTVSARRRLHFSVLLYPFPFSISPRDFSTVEGPLGNMNPERFGFFQFDPADRLDPARLGDCIDRALERLDQIDAVVLPEAAVTPLELDDIQATLRKRQIPLLLAGVRGPTDAAGLATNYVHLGVDPGEPGGWRPYQQDKHHRWVLDQSQISQYHLGPALNPARRWWEAIRIPPRRLILVTLTDWLTLCPLVCEDLARPDPVANTLRQIGPPLVIAILSDGPQLGSRWPARYATVLADDPGSSVLTLSSLGMVARSRPVGSTESRVIAAWKDPNTGLQEIAVDVNAQAVAITATAVSTDDATADGRPSRSGTLMLAGVEQIRC